MWYTQANGITAKRRYTSGYTSSIQHSTMRYTKFLKPLHNLKHANLTLTLTFNNSCNYSTYISS